MPATHADLFDDHHALVAMDGGKSGERLFPLQLTARLVGIELVDQAFAPLDERVGLAQATAEFRPVCSVQILDHIDRILPQPWKEVIERGVHVGRLVAAVIQHNIRYAKLGQQARQERRVGLRSDSHRDLLFLGGLARWIDIDADNLGVRPQKSPPHFQAAPMRNARFRAM